MWFLNFLLLLSFFPLSTSRVLNIRREPESDAKSKIVEYLKHYEGPNSGLLSTFPDYDPSVPYKSENALSQAAAIYKALIESTTTDAIETDNLHFIMKMKVYETLDTTDQYSVIYDNKEGKFDFIVVAATHGFWVLGLLREYSEHVYKLYRQSRGSERRKRFFDSASFKIHIVERIIDGGGNNFQGFVDQLRYVGGSITRIGMIKNVMRDHQGNTVQTDNVLVLGAIKQKLEQGQIFLDEEAKEKIIDVDDDTYSDWPSGNRKLFVTFFYNSHSTTWITLSMFASQLGVYSSICPECGTVPKGLWNEAHQLQPSDSSAVYSLVKWGTSGTPADVMFLAMPPVSTSTTKKRLGPAIILLTNKGFFFVWYPFKYYNLIAPSRNPRPRQRRHALEQLNKRVKIALNELKTTGKGDGAFLVGIIAFISTIEDNSIYTKDFIDQLLRTVYEATISLQPPPGPLWQPLAVSNVMLLLGKTSYATVQQRFMMTSPMEDGVQYFRIYYGGYMQFEIKFHEGQSPKSDLTRLFMTDLRTLASGRIVDSSDGARFILPEPQPQC